jgi:2-phospho-L-lactate transferase/gluconeogenesis factor (CofD/UPF0052 family)
MNEKSIVTLIGCGSGLRVVATGLQRHSDLDLAAIINGADQEANCEGSSSYVLEGSNRDAIGRIIHSNLIVVCPGRLDRVVSLLTASGMPLALKNARGNCVYICKLTIPSGSRMTSADAFVRDIESRNLQGIFNYVLYHKPQKSDTMFIRPPTHLNGGKPIYLGLDLIATTTFTHDPSRTAEALLALIPLSDYYFHSVR